MSELYAIYWRVKKNKIMVWLPKRFYMSLSCYDFVEVRTWTKLLYDMILQDTTCTIFPIR